MMKLQHFLDAFLCLVTAVLVPAKVDSVIEEVSFAEVYRHWSVSETEKSIHVNAILIRMNENPDTGYRW
jgi:predicted secreted protein